MKQFFMEPEVEVIRLDGADIITSSDQDQCNCSGETADIAA
jgi:hypothetical protein